MHARILTVNVQNTEGDPRRQDVLRDAIERAKPDLISLQEVVDLPARRQLDDLLAGSELQSTHQADVIAYEPAWADRYGGTALASRWPHRVVETLDLRVQQATDVPWCTLAAVVEVPDLGEMLFVASTASWRFDAAAVRERQAVAVADLDARHRRTLPTVIAGDFNADPDASSIRYLTGRQSLSGSSVHYVDAWEVAGSGHGHTWCDDNPIARPVIERLSGQQSGRHRFDYVFIGSGHAHPDAYCHVLSARLAFDQPTDHVWASDHFAVIVDLDIGIR